MKSILAAFHALLLVSVLPVPAAEFHVAPTGDDVHVGTPEAPLRTIQRAAELAQPGDVVIVHEGIYRERINPPRGGQSDAKRIVYQAAPGEQVEIRGSEIVKDWTKVENDTWKATLPKAFFGAFNPYSDLISGDWFNPKGRKHHTGAVYLNGEWLTEAANFDDVLKPADADPFWFARVDDEKTTLWAQFPAVDPNEQLVEINVRRAVFYPDKPGRNFITVRGFIMRHAATPWAPPTAEQIGLIGTHWSKGWIIEDNVISHSACTGITLGKYGDKWDNKSQSADAYNRTIQRALENGWHKDTIGQHVVRNNTISHCEQAGLVGSLGAVFSTITGNSIHDIHVRRLFTGAEMAGIKLHGAIDVEISQNHIYRTTRGLWLDWMAQGTRVSRNLFHDNGSEDLFVEVNHGPFLVDNNLFLSPGSLLDMSQGGAYVHNLMAGRIVSLVELRRKTPFHPPHATAVAGLANIKGGDNRFYNNVFIGAGEAPGNPPKPDDRHRRLVGFGPWVYNAREFASAAEGNVYYHGARPYAKEIDPTVASDVDPQVKVLAEDSRVLIEWTPVKNLQKANAPLVTTELLGKAKVSGVPYENADGSPLAVDVDYFGNQRSRSRPAPGPFENPSTGTTAFEVWKND